MSKNLRIALIVFVLLVFCMGFYFSPYLAVHNMRNAAAGNDGEALSGYVDFPLLRESLKANFNAKLVSEAAKNKNPFETFGSALAMAMIGPMVDAMVTPESVAMMMKGKKPKLSPPGDKPAVQEKPEADNTETSMAYRGLNKFVLSIRQKDKTDEPIELIFRRNTLFFWKLSSLRM